MKRRASAALPTKKAHGSVSSSTRAIPSSHSSYKKVVVDYKEHSAMQEATPQIPHARVYPVITSRKNDPTNPTGDGLNILKEILSEQTGLDIGDIYDSPYED